MAKVNGSISRTDFFMDCDEAGYPYSKLPTMGPFFTCWIDILCVCYFFFNRWYKRRWKVTTSHDTFANIAMILIFLVSLIDLVYSIITLSQPFLSSFARPLILATCMSSLRHNAHTLWLDVKQSSIILLSIFLFVMAYSMVGFFVF